MISLVIYSSLSLALLQLLIAYRRIFADVIVYIFCSLAYDLPNRSRGRIYELNAKVERAD